MSKHRNSTPFDWPGVGGDGRHLALQSSEAICPACRYWLARPVMPDVQRCDALLLRAFPAGYKRKPFEGELGPGEDTEHLIHVAWNGRGGIHYKLLHIVRGGGAG